MSQQQNQNQNQNNKDKDSDIEELIRERANAITLKKKAGSGFYFSGNIANAYRILDTMANNKQSKNFFSIYEMGRYETTGFPVPKQYRTFFIERAKRAGLVKEIILPDRIHSMRTKKYSEDAQAVIKDINIDFSSKSLRNRTYYKITDEGKRLYKNLKEIFEILA